MMYFDDKFFEFIVLEPQKFERLKDAIQRACKGHGSVKIRSALISKIVVDANECTSEASLKRFIEYYPSLNDICKVHLQYPHDILFPVEVECSSDNVQTSCFFSGFLYNYKFIHTTTLLENENNAPLKGLLIGILNNPRDPPTYPHTNWYHDQAFLRLTLPKKFPGNLADLRLDFDYSSFLKIYIYRPKKEVTEPRRSATGGFDLCSVLDSMLLERSTYQMTFTIALGYQPSIFTCGKGIKLTRIHDLPSEPYWKGLIRSSAIQVKLSFGSEKECQDFISHLHAAVNCPIVFLPNPLDIQPSDIPLIQPSISTWPWEIQYGIQMIMDCGDIGCYHFHKQNYASQIACFVRDGKIKDALAYLSAIHANLKLQPMMEIFNAPRPISVNFGEDYVMMRTVIITPTRRICCPPMQLMSSRAFRILGGAEKFIQIKFRDEDMQIMRRDEVMMKQVILEPGYHGVVIAGKKFFELARSNSMFREHGSYFYQTENRDDIVRILKSLGNFKPEPSCKTAARVGQYFTSAKEVKRQLLPHEFTVIPDYMSSTTNGIGENYCFSDGVGIISYQFATAIQEEFNISYLPSAFQIRCLGFKGVLSIDHRHPLLIDAGGSNLVLFRESQKKFDVSESMEVVLGIVKYSAPASVRFNKPLINLWDQAAKNQGLSSGFDKRVNELFSISLYDITSVLINNSRFNDALRKLPTYVNLQQTVRQVWINEPFFRSMVSAAALQQLKALQYYKQISLPTHLGRSLLGIVDLTGILKPGQVFVQYRKHVGAVKDGDDKYKIVCEGKVAVSRSPVYNIGDLRILKAVDIPQLRHLCDVIVFPNNGSRPHPDEMSGGDLDGDEYSVVWDPDLMLQYSEVATDYTPTKVNPERHRIEDLPLNSAKFRYDFMMNDRLAMISNCHLAHSDLHSLEHPQVIAMAQNADLAVNYFKSGVPSDDIDKDHMCDWYPDFMDKPHLPSYVSPRLLGRLHRKCDRFWNVTMNIINENRYSKAPLDPAYDIDGWEEYKDEAIGFYKTYNSEIEHLKSTYGIKTEGELFSNQLGAILGRLRTFDADNSTANSTKNLIQNHVVEIFRRYRQHYLTSIGEKVEGLNGNQIASFKINCVSSKAKKIAVAYYKAAYEDGGSLSFPWIAWEVLDNIWSESNGVVSSNPIYDLVDKELGSNDSTVNLTNAAANIAKFTQIISTWLKKFNYQTYSFAADMDIVMEYVFKLRSDKQEFNNVVKVGKKLVEFFAAVGSFEFLELHPSLKRIHEAAQDTYCRIAFAPFTLNKPNIFKQRKVRGKAFVIAIPKEMRNNFLGKKEFLKSQSGCSQISFRFRKQNKHHIHFYVWSQGTLQQNETLKDILTITPEIQKTKCFEEVRAYKHALQRSKIF